MFIDRSLPGPPIPNAWHPSPTHNRRKWWGLRGSGTSFRGWSDPRKDPGELGGGRVDVVVRGEKVDV